MSKRAMLSAFVLLTWGMPVAAQDGVQLDSLIARWIEVGASSRWQPYTLFKGCPNLTLEQEHGIEKVLSLQLAEPRRRTRIQALMFPFADCGHQRLEQWFFARMDEAVRNGTLYGELELKLAFMHANTATVRQYLLRMMTDRSLPDYPREIAGFTLLAHLPPGERLDVLIAAFEAGTLPWGVAVGGTGRLLEEDGAALVARMNELVRRNPMLARETAFMQLAETGPAFLSEDLRRSLGQALADGLRNRPDIDMGTREELESLAEWLRQPRRREPR